ncbi:cell number regulator 8-like [Nicotiana sylvestris]|uniref:Cell number regulator 8-like n=1 Tax=Nicotiana sylvestris TaxID=4096 RepID=A0A1U7VRK1_NICSY|nr:PREDICTED: cell number regulator 8-like [Nicotiana sylvestris]XP_016458706.1 PREDICTED: cell number regulator 8-like [Nicotiana tabacum]
MANNMEESSPFLPRQKSETTNNELKSTKLNSSTPAPPVAAEPVKPTASAAVPMGWTANGLPIGHGPVVGEPIMRRAQWESGLCSCFGKNDEFVSSDLEVCLLGTLAPCVLYGSNAERIGSAPGSFSNHCLPYTGLYLIGQSFFGWNCMAPWFSYPSRTALRQKFNLEGNCEAVTRSCGCYGGFVEDEERREQCESTCDFATHIFCHPCALCQEGRELRRRLPHPGFNTKPVLVMLPPGEQNMGR